MSTSTGLDKDVTLPYVNLPRLNVRTISCDAFILFRYPFSFTTDGRSVCP